LVYLCKKGYRKGKVNTLQAITFVGAKQNNIQLGSENSMLWYLFEGTNPRLQFTTEVQKVKLVFKDRAADGFNATVIGTIYWKTVSATAAADHGSQAVHVNVVAGRLWDYISEYTSVHIGKKTSKEVDTNKDDILNDIANDVITKISSLEGYKTSDKVIASLGIMVTALNIADIQIESKYDDFAPLVAQAEMTGQASLVKTEKTALAILEIDKILKDPKESSRFVQRQNGDVSTEEKIISINDEDGALTAAAAILGIASNNENMVEMIEQSGLLKKGFLSSKKKGSSSSSSSLDKDDKSKK
ncbi:MAG: hypothetical protein KBB70_00430, partial [Candidatus Pacebacteria bacterium]|nr:hypothetical protein [Candidatus Paceibacterota bacterium]